MTEMFRCSSGWSSVFSSWNELDEFGDLKRKEVQTEATQVKVTNLDVDEI